MNQEILSPARANLAEKLRQAFLDFGYEHLTMLGLSKACGLTRRALYHHFSNKEEAFRFMLQYDTNTAMAAALKAGNDGLAEGRDVVDTLTAMMDARYAFNRRRLVGSPHAADINVHTIRLARDIMVNSAQLFQDRLAELLAEMDRRGLIRLRPTISFADLAQVLADGARGANQSLPPVHAEDLPQRYRIMIATLLFGAVERDPAR